MAARALSPHAGLRRFAVPVRLLAAAGAALSLHACALTAPFRDTAPVATGVGASAPERSASPDAQILAALDASSAGERIAVGDGRVAQAGAIYSAASGRRCREVAIGAGDSVETRLACSEGGTWSWYPYVLP